MSGALFNSSFEENVTRTEVLKGISTQTLGIASTAFLSLLVSLACFTTGVGIITGAADYIKSIFKNSQKVYVITTFISCVLGVVIGQFSVHYIIDIALPVLMFMYPVTIVLILLNILPDYMTSPFIFRGVIITTFLFSIPDFLGFFVPKENLNLIREIIPLSSQSLGWVIPACVVFVLLNLHTYIKNNLFQT